MKIVHIVPGIRDVTNGMVIVARLLAKEQGDAEVIDLNSGISGIDGNNIDEVWVHGMWLPKEWFVCMRVLKKGKRLIRMTHGSLSPVYLRHQSPFTKWLVGPIERYFLRKADKVVATCETEADWIRAYLGRRCPPIIVTDIKRFFNLPNSEAGALPKDRPLHLLYLGRRHPLKGLSYLESALTTYYNMLSKPQVVSVPSDQPSATYYNKCSVEFRAVSNAFGEELEKVWDWCDVLVLPTLSDNFGLVIAEALERGKRVITTDGAPAWGPEECGNMEMLQISNSNIQSGSGIWEGYGGRLLYLKGYREGSDEERVRLLNEAISKLALCADDCGRHGQCGSVGRH